MSYHPGPYDQRFHYNNNNTTTEGEDIIQEGHDHDQEGLDHHHHHHHHLDGGDGGDEGNVDISRQIVQVYIYNLPPWIKWRDLKTLLIQFIQDTVILHIQLWNQNVQFTNAIVSLNSYQASLDLFDNLNNYEWNGFMLSVMVEDENNLLPLNPTNQFSYHHYSQHPMQPNFAPTGPPMHPHHPSTGMPSSAFSPTAPYYNLVPVFPHQLQPSLPHGAIPQQIPAYPQQPQPISQIQQQGFMISPPQVHSLPIQYPHTPISRPSSKSRHPSISYSSPKIQPSRQINLHQLNYRDITDINDHSNSSFSSSATQFLQDGSQQVLDKTRLFIGNIPFESDWRDLKDYLRRATGNIIRVEIPRNDNGSKGFGIATFPNEEDAQRVIELCNGTMFEGRPLTVRYDKYPKLSRSGSIGPNGVPVDHSLSRQVSPEKEKEKIIPEESSGDLSFDDGEFATEARNLAESLNKP